MKFLTEDQINKFADDPAFFFGCVGLDYNTDQLIELLRKFPNDADALAMRCLLERDATELQNAVNALALKSPDHPCVALGKAELLAAAGDQASLANALNYLSQTAVSDFLSSARQAARTSLEKLGNPASADIIRYDQTTTCSSAVARQCSMIVVEAWEGLDQDARVQAATGILHIANQIRGEDHETTASGYISSSNLLNATLSQIDPDTLIGDGDNTVGSYLQNSQAELNEYMQLVEQTTEYFDPNDLAAYHKFRQQQQEIGTVEALKLFLKLEGHLP